MDEQVMDPLPQKSEDEESSISCGVEVEDRDDEEEEKDDDDDEEEEEEKEDEDEEQEEDDEEEEELDGLPTAVMMKSPPLLASQSSHLDDCLTTTTTAGTMSPFPLDDEVSVRFPHLAKRLSSGIQSQEAAAYIDEVFENKVDDNSQTREEDPPTDPQQQRQQRRKSLILTALLALNIVSIAVTVKYAFRNGEPTTMAPTSAPTVYTGWFQYGDEIEAPIEFNGENEDAAQMKFGWSVAVSAETRILAVGSPGRGRGTGSVFVYGLDVNEFKWKHLGEPLIGSNAGDAFGSSIALSDATGETLAVGAWNYGAKAGQVNVYQYTPGGWHKKGQTLLGQERTDDVFGSVVVLSADGSVVAASAAQGDVKSIEDKCRGANAGFVQVFRFNSTDEKWYQLGETLTGELSYDQFGFSIDLSADATILAVGAPYSDKSEGASWAGLVKVYKYNEDANEWIQFGQTLRPKDTNDRFGWSVNLSHDGKIVAVGAPLNDDNGEASGQLSVFKYNQGTNNWEPMGDIIQGQDLGRWFANNVFLSKDGLMVAASLWGDAYWRERIRYGGVRVFRFEGGEWKQVGGDLPGETLYDPYSTTVTMSSGGNIVMSGWNDDTETGVVRAYYAG